MIVLAVLLLLLGIAYAALSTTLNVNFGDVTQTAQSWDVSFETNSSITASVAGLGPSGRSCGTASASGQTVTVSNTTLSKPGDRCRWTLKILNNGSINAKLSTISQVAPTGVSCTENTKASMICGNITYKITTDSSGNNLIAVNKTINANSNLNVYLFAYYSGADIHTGDIVQSNASFSLVFSQK